MEGGKMVGRGKGESQNWEHFKESKIGGRGIPEINRKIIGNKNDAFFPIFSLSSPLSSLP